MKDALHIIIVLVVGSVIGMFIGKLCNIWFPAGHLHNLMTTAINTGLKPSTLDLSIIEFTIGFMFKFNVPSLLGIFIAAIVYKKIIKK